MHRHPPDHLGPATPLLHAMIAALDGIALAKSHHRGTRDWTARRLAALVSLSQRRDVLTKPRLIGSEAERVFGDPDAFALEGADAQKGAFVPADAVSTAPIPMPPPICARHRSFGPVSNHHALTGEPKQPFAMLNKGKGVAAFVDHHPGDGDCWHRQMAMGPARFTGAALFSTTAELLWPKATGHGCPPAPFMVHAGPDVGRRRRGAGGSRCAAVMHLHLQRTAIQGQPRHF